MLTLISKNTNSQRLFSDLCKSKNFDFVIVGSVVELFYFKEKVVSSFVIIDWNNDSLCDLVKQIILKTNLISNCVAVCNDSVDGISFTDNINSAIEIAVYHINKNGNTKYDIDSLDKIIKNELLCYNFSTHYLGFGYMRKVCEHHILYGGEIFNFNESVEYISRCYGETNTSAITRDIRYLINQNKNSKIREICDQNPGSKTKAVLCFLIDNIKTKLKKDK